MFQDVNHVVLTRPQELVRTKCSMGVVAVVFAELELVLPAVPSAVD